MKKFEWRTGYISTKVVAQVVGEFLESLPEIKPDIVVEKAKESDNPLHPLFEWNDSIAGHKYRLGQASEIIRAVVIVEHEKPEFINQNAFVKVQEVKTYKPIDTITTDDFEFIRRAAYNELQSFIRKYSRIKGLESAVNILNEAIQLLSTETQKAS
ncbi:MAG: hypothetical protein KG029_04780 [Bacteroidetes bacterium]|nr:hypothetical protein [Bacteroidota bacterium]